MEWKDCEQKERWYEERWYEFCKISLLWNVRMLLVGEEHENVIRE